MAFILESSGLFWWYGAKTKEGCYAPLGAVSGELKIENDGTARLALTGMLTPKNDAAINIFKQKRSLGPDVLIQGILKNSSQNVLLGRIRADASHVTSVGMSHESFLAADCIISVQQQAEEYFPICFNTLISDLSGLEDWLDSDGIKIHKKRRGYSATYIPSRSTVQNVAGAKLTVFNTVSPNFYRSSILDLRKIEIRHLSAIELRYKVKKTIQQIRDDFQIIEDLIFFLTGIAFSLEWPTLKMSTKAYTYFFRREKNESKPIGLFDSYIPYKVVEKDIGLLFESLRSAREDLGPGLYLYLATNRTSKIFIENRFVNLIWGLESLHRITADEVVCSSRLKDKIDRIINDVSLEKDKKWLINKLKNSHEPSLEERLMDIFSSLSLKLNPQNLRLFCKECAALRNEISHFGGQKKGSYDEFLSRISPISEAIQLLYHAVLLKKIGVSEQVIYSWINNGPNSYGYRKLFNFVGLKKD